MEYFINATSNVPLGFHIDNYTQSTITYLAKVYNMSVSQRYITPSYSIRQNWIT